MFKNVINFLFLVLLINSKLITAKNIDIDKFERNTDKVPIFLEYSSKDICNKQKFYITPLKINKDVSLNNGVLYGIMKDNNKNYSIELVLKNNHLVSLNVYDNTLSIGIRGSTQVLDFSCSILSHSTNIPENIICNLNSIFSYNEKRDEDLKKICFSNHKNRKIQSSDYMGNRFSNYLLANGFKVDFINHILHYKAIKNHGILDY